MTRSEITRTVAQEALAHYGSISLAAKAMHGSFEGRLGRPPAARTIEGWLLTALRSELAPGLMEDADPESTHENAIRELLERANIPPEAIARGNMKSVALRSWGVAAKVKDADGNEHLEKEGLWSTAIQLDSSILPAPAWPVIQQPAPLEVKYTRERLRSVSTTVERTFLIPDIQIGFWKTADGLIPMHDESAIETMLAVLYDFHADRVIVLGDFLDCSELSRFTQMQEFQETLQPALEYAYRLLTKIRSIVGPKVEIVYIPGNHERRVSEYIVKNARAAFGIRRAGFDTSAWPVMSVPNLLRLDELAVDYREEYPGGQYFITPDLVCQHAPPTSKMDMRASVIHGHHPQYTVSSRTVHYIDGPKTYYTFCIPGLMRIDDTLDRTMLHRTLVPSDRSRVSWCQGIGGVFVDKMTKLFTVEVYPITNGQTIYGGRLYTRADAVAMSKADFEKKWLELGHRKR